MSKLRKITVLLIWSLGNFASVGLLVFSDSMAVKITSWIWVSTAITVAGIVEIGALFGSSISSEK